MPVQTQEDINRIAWKACDTFRGSIDPAQYKDYILTMMFFKYISDVWHDHYEAYAKQYGDNPERIERLMLRDRFVLPVVTLPAHKGESPDSFRADFQNLFDRRERNNIGELIDIALRQIAEANKDRLHFDDVFRGISFNSENALGDTAERNARLKSLLNNFYDLDLRPSHSSEDVIGNTYMYLIERFASDAGKKAGEFYTPTGVSTLLARLVDPRPGMRICDPTCGSAGLLIEAARAVAEHGDARNVALYGQEMNQGTYALALMNMFIHGYDAARIERGDTLRNPLLLDGDRLLRFDIVVANPPFSLDQWGVDEAGSDRFKRFWRGLPPKSRGDYAFVSHMIEVALPQRGRVAVVVPHGVLFRGASEGRIRQRLIEDNLLDAVIGLPANLFPTTGIPVAILVFDRAREPGGAREAVDDVLFIDASRDFQPVKTRNRLAPEHIERVLATHRARQPVERYAALVSRADIAANDYNLNIARYLDSSEPEPEIDLRAVQRDIDRLETELAAVRAEMRQHLAALGVLE
ncbi:type I restriction-modification system subunit M [Roseateles sp. BYS78W]|uniref:site-specific DNA-methyltransferase (adenine-specific) n=1 Tax=Pelomonas candidula TaxID=3299025 RepID=A0ABW7H696_9BURK